MRKGILMKAFSQINLSFNLNVLQKNINITGIDK